MKPRKSMDEYEKLLTPTVYSDTPTFLGVPLAKTKEDLIDKDAAIIGMPQQAPKGSVGREIGYSILDTIRLRKASMKYGGYLPELYVDVFEHINLVDYGDMAINFPIATDEDLFKYFEQVDKKVGEVLEAGCIPITILCHPYAIAKSIANRTNGKVGIIHIDAHGDNLDSFLGSKWSGPCHIARIAEIENVDTKNLVQMGVRGPRNFKEQIDWFKEKGCRLYTYWEMKKKGIEKVTKEALDYARDGTDALFISLDIDSLDLGTAPGLDEPLGITTAELLSFMCEAGKAGVTGLNIECIPTPAWEAYHPPAMPLYWIVTWAILYMLAGKALNSLKR